jgi:alkaline phosphatase D
MMGAEQEKWLYDNLADAHARWTIVGQQVPTFARDFKSWDADSRFAMDKWDGYTAARQRLYTHLKNSKAPNPVVLSGDVHMHYAADLKMNFDEPRSPTIGVELTNSSITSIGDGADVSGEWEAMRSDNPHIKYHSARRGYIACTATPSTLRAEFKILDRVTIADQPIRVGGAMVVEAGRPGGTTD